MKKTIILLLTIVLLGLGWTIGWFFVQGRVEQMLDAQIARLEQEGKIIECQKKSVGGYPFRIVVDCPGFLFNDIGSGFGFNFKSVKTAAQVYQPGKIVAEMHPVGSLNLPQQGLMAVDWNSLRASVFATLQGVERFSLLGKEMQIVPVNNELAAASFGEIQLHGRKSEENDVQLAIRASNATSKLALWPDFDLEMYFSFSAVYKQLMAGKMFDEIGRISGLKGELEKAVFSPKDAGKVTMSGPFSVNENGLVSGRFDLVASDVPALIEALAKSNPLFQQEVRNLGTMLSSVAQRNADGSMSIVLVLDKGQVNFGLIPVGFFPPVY